MPIILPDSTRRGFLKGLFSVTAGATLSVGAERVAKAIILDNDDPIWMRLRGADGIALNGAEPVGVMRRFMLEYRDHAPFRLVGYRDGDRLVNQEIYRRLLRYGDAVKLIEDPRV